MDKIAKSTSLNCIPIDKPAPIKISLFFNEEQFSKLVKGIIPQQMEDKWFIYYENDWLLLHRSWTGFGIYKAQILKENEYYFIKEFWVERNIEKYSNQDEEVDIKTFVFLIARGLLKVEVSEIYFDKDIEPESNNIKGWSNFGNLLFTPPGDHEKEK